MLLHGYRKGEKMEIKADLLQDSIGQLCPMPIAHLAMNMRKMENGQILEIRSDDDGAHADIPSWCRQTNNEFLEEKNEGNYFSYFVKKSS